MPVDYTYNAPGFENVDITKPDGSEQKNILDNAARQTRAAGKDAWDKFKTDHETTGLHKSNFLTAAHFGIGKVLTDIQTKNAAYTIAAAEKNTLFLADTTGGNFTLTMPDVIGLKKGDVLVFKKTVAANVLTIAPFAGQLIDGVGGNITLSGSGDTKFLVCDALANGWRTVGQIIGTGAASTVAKDYVLISDEKTAGTAGGTATAGSWVRRNLNTEMADTANIATVAGDQITLAAGTYTCRISCPSFNTSEHRARLRVAAGATLLTGTSEYSASGGGQTNSIITGRFVLAATTILEVEHRVASTRTTDGWGRAANFLDIAVDTDERYTVAEFWREG